MSDHAKIQARALIDNKKKEGYKPMGTPRERENHQNCLKLVNIMEAIVKNPIEANGNIYGGIRFDYSCEEFTNFMNEHNSGNDMIKIKIGGFKLPLLGYSRSVNYIESDINTQQDKITYTLSNRMGRLGTYNNTI